MGEFEDQIADVVIAQFDALPAKSKPSKCEKGSFPWVPLSGIVVSHGDGNSTNQSTGIGR